MTRSEVIQGTAVRVGDKGTETSAVTPGLKEVGQGKLTLVNTELYVRNLATGILGCGAC